MAHRPSHVVVLDVDGTLTPKKRGKPNSLVEAVDHGTLPDDAKAEMNGLRDRYLSRAVGGHLLAADQSEWMTETLNTYVRHSLHFPSFCSVIGEVALRPGVKECLAMLRAANVPVALISFGVADFVEAYLEAHGIGEDVDRVYAARLTFDDHGDCNGFHPETIVVPATKGVSSRQFADSYGVSHRQIVAVGDTGGDKFLGHLKEHRLLIACDDEEAVKLAPMAGEVIVTDDFAPVTAWLKEKLGLT